ncbi:MAG: hypothetical protein Q8Q88_03535 [Phenylobacterium sp.]|uniref:hypothetical protein n=1 Tax=Phenylobacterium sp. TaxID=1871053 RepID=UPI002736A939|nr:hypothetical protein [Phenylobacterium sp.]MDP3746102.1 hypothetical protein [Phenylobacterium sp.]
MSERYGLAKTQLFTWRREARRQVVVEDPADQEEPQVGGGAIEIELPGARVRIGREADARMAMAVAVIGALRAGR